MLVFPILVFESAAVQRAARRANSQPPPQSPVTISNLDVGRTRVTCAPLPPQGELEGTLAPPTPLQIEEKYEEIRNGNPDGVTEVLVTYSYPEPFGMAEARVVFDADEHFQLVTGQSVSVLDLFRGMQVVMRDGTIGTILGNPERRFDIPVPPLTTDNRLWTSRVTAQARHTAYEIVEFRWAGQLVQVTPGHEVWSRDRNRWVGAHELLPGEQIRAAGNYIAPVESTRRVAQFIEVFGIEVEYFHNYFVGTGPDAMLVHNGLGCVNKPLNVDPSRSEVLSRRHLELLDEGVGFKTFKELKDHLGPPPPDHAWHHIVGQNADNIARFGPEYVHNTANVVAISHGKGSTHLAQIEAFLNSYRPEVTGFGFKRVRDWLKMQSYQFQYEFGVIMLRNNGVSFP